MLLAKLHGLRVTGAELHYEGSIQLDPEHYGRAGILPFQFVEIWNKSSGARISTYVIPGEPGSRCCVLNGAAARTCQVGDELIIAARGELEEHEIERLRSRVLIFGHDNELTQLHEYRLTREPPAGWKLLRIDAGAQDFQSRNKYPLTCE